MIARWAIGIAVFGASSALAVTPSNAEFRVCNESGEKVDVAVTVDCGRPSAVPYVTRRSPSNRLNPSRVPNQM